ncbi:MAG: AAA family ATPase, partial [Anaerolineae bacterium]|nr:AAA family ATPase [Anaerolineae bacterium]
MQNIVPHFILEKHGNIQGGGETHGQFDAAALFVDVSGFSTATHALSQHGSEAAEVMADIMGCIFDPLVDAVYAHGGFINGFAGDGFTALFPADGSQHLLRALAAGRAIQAHIAANPVHDTTYGRFPFAVKLGLAHGPVHWGILYPAEADEYAPAAYYFGGFAIDGAAEAEHLSQPGTLILAPEVLSALAELVQTLPAGDEGHARVLGLAPGHTLPAPAALPPVEALPGQERFVSPEILAHIGGGEFRQVVTVFINLMGVQAHADLAPFVQAVFRLRRELGGTLARVDFGDKGCTLLLFWGVPAGSESDVDRALDFALALGEHTPGSYKAGLTYATMYAGPAGSVRRGEWTCYGDGINLAARLMTAAPWGGLWLDECLARRVGGQFIAEEVGRRTFKGFDAPLLVYTLAERQRPEVVGFFRDQMVGHAADMDRLEAFIGPLLAPPGERRSAGILSVEGEAGLGKSRLVAEFLLRLTAPTESGEAHAQWALCQTDAAVRAPFNPWCYWLRSYFQQSPGASAARNKRAFGRVLDRLIAATEDTELQTELNRGRPFLGALLDLYWDASPYAEMPPEGRYELTLTALAALVRAESRRCPLVLNVEDAHWLDEDSLAVVTRLTRVAAHEPWAMLATARPVVGDRPLFGNLAYERLALGALSSAELAELAGEVLGGPVDVEVSTLLEARAEGNPFFAEQILRFLQEKGGLVADGDAWRLAEGVGAGAVCLPADVRLIFTSRLDALSREVRDVVQTAAVLGR